MALRAPMQEEETCGILAYFLHQVFHRNELTGALGHFHLLPVAQQRYILQNQHFQSVFAVAEGLDSSFHAPDISMVIWAPNVNQFSKASLELIMVIGNVCGYIGVGSVALDNHPVLVIAKLG